MTQNEADELVKECRKKYGNNTYQRKDGVAQSKVVDVQHDRTNPKEDPAQYAVFVYLVTPPSEPRSSQYQISLKKFEAEYIIPA